MELFINKILDLLVTYIRSIDINIYRYNKERTITQRGVHFNDGSFLCVVKTQEHWSNKIYKTELTDIR